MKFTYRSNSSRPSWIKELPKGLMFNYYVGMATSNISLDQAKDLAISDAVSSLMIQNELYIEGTITTNDTEFNNKLISSVSKDIKLTGKSDIVKGLEKEEDYWDICKTSKQSMFRYWVLMRVPKQPNTFTADKMNQPNYGITPIFKSIAVPGWGQIQKGEPIKGFVFLSSIALTTTAGFITLNLSNGYKNDADTAHNSEWVDYYDKMSDQYFYASLASFIIAGALYGYNIFDVISSKGAKIYAYENKRGLNINLLPNKVYALSLSYKF
jgi:hypothetical protein